MVIPKSAESTSGQETASLHAGRRSDIDISYLISSSWFVLTNPSEHLVAGALQVDLVRIQ